LSGGVEKLEIFGGSIDTSGKPHLFHWDELGILGKPRSSLLLKFSMIRDPLKPKDQISVVGDHSAGQISQKIRRWTHQIFSIQSPTIFPPKTTLESGNRRLLGAVNKSRSAQKTLEKKLYLLSTSKKIKQ
jgi:hypothetical protein